MNTTLLLRHGLCLTSMLWMPSSAVQASPTENGDSNRLTSVESEALRQLRTLRDPEAAGPTAVGDEIRTLGSGCISILLTVLDEGRVMDPAEPEGEAQLLSSLQTEAALRALRGFGRETALPLWEERFSGLESEKSRFAAMLSLGAIGEASDLAKIWELAIVSDGGEPSSTLGKQLELATSDILARNPAAFEYLDRNWNLVSESLIDDLIRAVGRSGDPRGLENMTRWLRWTPTHQRLIASQILLLGPSNDTDLNRRLSSALSELLEHDSKEDVQAASLAIGILEDIDALPQLIELADDERPGVSANVRRALQDLTHKSLGGGTPIWRRWYKEELAWHRSERATVIARLDSGDEPQVLRALRDISLHTLHRHDLAQIVAPHLFSPSVTIRSASAQVLRDLGSRWAAGDLIVALSDDSETVQNAAHAALVSITGQDRGPRQADWEWVEFPTNRR